MACLRVSRGAWARAACLSSTSWPHLRDFPGFTGLSARPCGGHHMLCAGCLAVLSFGVILRRLEPGGSGMVPESLPEALTFDDVLLQPGYSDFVPSEAEVGTQLTRELRLNI